MESLVIPQLQLDDIRVLLVEVSSLDPDPDLKANLVSRMGEPVVVNEVYEGEDLAFTNLLSTDGK